MLAESGNGFACLHLLEEIETVSEHPHCHRTLKRMLQSLQVPPGSMHEEEYCDPFLQEVALICEAADFFTARLTPRKIISELTPLLGLWSLPVHLFPVCFQCKNITPRILYCLLQDTPWPAISESSFSHSS